MSKDGWIGVDLDGTLAHYEGWVDETHIGEPIPLMVERVRGWLAEGKTVKIMTARVSHDPLGICQRAIEDWCLAHLGQRLLVTNEKDYGMYELWDDRAVSVELNTGRCITIGRDEPVTP